MNRVKKENTRKEVERERKELGKEYLKTEANEGVKRKDGYEGKDITRRTLKNRRRGNRKKRRRGIQEEKKGEGTGEISKAFKSGRKDWRWKEKMKMMMKIKKREREDNVTKRRRRKSEEGKFG